MADSVEIVHEVEAKVDGRRLSDLIDQLPVSRGSVFQLLKALEIKTIMGPGPNGKGRVAWLNADDAARLEEVAGKVAQKLVKIGEVGALARSLHTPQTQEMVSESAESVDDADGASLLQRMQAADLAARSGFPLTTAELTWVLGVRPGGAVVQRGGLEARRQSRNVWRLSAESADSET